MLKRLILVQLTDKRIGEFPYVNVKPEIIEEKEAEGHVKNPIFYRHLGKYVPS